MNKEGDLPRTAIMLLAFGGPGSSDEVALFLERLMGKKPAREQLAGLQRRYQAIGGASPLPAMTLHQARALAEELQKRGKHLPVYCGMRYSHPLIADTLEEIKKEGASKIILIGLSPYRSSYSAEGYYTEVKRVVAPWNKSMELVQIEGWYAHPGLCAAWAKRIKEGMGRISAQEGETPVIFTAHSLPLDGAIGSPYVRQLEETIGGIIRITGPVRRHLAFQSRGRGGAWLGPEPEVVLEELFKEGYRKAMICPIGFISDHLETLYDLDIALKEWADKQGIEVMRTPCLNDAPELIKVLAQLVEEALEKQ
jgi:ferrochelatase